MSEGGGASTRCKAAHKKHRGGHLKNRTPDNNQTTHNEKTKEQKAKPATNNSSTPATADPTRTKDVSAYARTTATSLHKRQRRRRRTSKLARLSFDPKLRAVLQQPKPADHIYQGPSRRRRTTCLRDGRQQKGKKHKTDGTSSTSTVHRPSSRPHSCNEAPLELRRRSDAPR